MCTEGTFYRECFKVSWEGCMEAATSVVDLCLDKLDHPPPGVRAAPGETWKDLIIPCLHGSYFYRHLLFFRDTEECEKAESWPL